MQKDGAVNGFEPQGGQLFRFGGLAVAGEAVGGGEGEDVDFVGQGQVTADGGGFDDLFKTAVMPFHHPRRLPLIFVKQCLLARFKVNQDGEINTFVHWLNFTGGMSDGQKRPFWRIIYATDSDWRVKKWIPKPLY